MSRLVAIIPNDVRARIGAMCDAAGNVETGGILVGCYEGSRRALVLDAMPPPPDSEHAPSEFLRGTVGVREALADSWPRAYYLGDWHYHPTDVVEPSPVDFAAMRAVAADPASQCACPLMVIAGRAQGDGQRPIRVYAFPGGDPEEIAA